MLQVQCFVSDLNDLFRISCCKISFSFNSNLSYTAIKKPFFSTGFNVEYTRPVTYVIGTYVSNAKS